MIKAGKKKAANYLLLAEYSVKYSLLFGKKSSKFENNISNFKYL